MDLLEYCPKKTYGVCFWGPYVKTVTESYCIYPEQDKQHVTIRTEKKLANVQRILTHVITSLVPVISKHASLQGERQTW